MATRTVNNGFGTRGASSRPPQRVSVIPDRAADAALLERVRRLAHVLDTSITLPGGWRIGLDPLIGLIPGFGDVAGVGLSTWIVLEAVRAGVPKEVLVRMLGNIALEAAVGTVPLAGDVFDAAWKSNVRNVRLIEAHLASPVKTKRASRLWIAAVIAGALLILIGAATVTFFVLRALVQLFSG